MTPREGKRKKRIAGNLIAPQVERLYRGKLLHEITTGYSGDALFAVDTASSPCVLRVCEFREKKQAHREFETRWTEYLAARMDGVAKPVRSVDHHLYEVIAADGQSYILSLQEKAPGKIVDENDPREFNETLFFELGMRMGQMHRLTRSYEGNRPCPEFKWNGPHFWRKDLAILDEDVRQGEKRFLQELARLPAGPENYGIVHYDIHPDNFLVENGRITFIDFDACQFHWYAADIASALFFMVRKKAGPLQGASEKVRTEFAETYLISYLKGYLQTNSLSAYWIRKLDLFMRYQMVDEYVAAQLGWPEGPAPLRQWYLHWHGDRIKQDLPYVLLDYEKILRGLPSVPR